LPPRWALSVLACPACKSPVQLGGAEFRCATHGAVGRWDAGIARFDVSDSDAQIAWYRSKGGANFQERIRIPFTMTGLDMPVYHSHLARIAPADKAGVIVDVGSGDGRNTTPWLDRGYQRVIAVDPIPAALERLRAALDASGVDSGERLLLVQSDARALPLATGAGACVFAIEALCYLNEDYSVGMRECARIVAPGARLLVSERSWEGGLLSSLLYDGVPAMVEAARSSYLLEGAGANCVRSRVFNRDELLAEIAKAGLIVDAEMGISLLSVAMGFLRGKGAIAESDASYGAEVEALLQQLGELGQARRAHVVVAQKS
jgi:SAM-dependent methyltransferase